MGAVGSRLATNARALCRGGGGTGAGARNWGCGDIKSIVESSRFGGGFAQPLLEPSGAFCKVPSCENLSKLLNLRHPEGCRHKPLHGGDVQAVGMARELDEHDCRLLGFLPVSCVISDP